MRRSLILIAALALAGGAVAQVVTHDPPVQKIMAAEVNPGALAFWAGGNDPPDGESKAEAKIRWADAVKGARRDDLLRGDQDAVRSLGDCYQITLPKPQPPPDRCRQSNLTLFLNAREAP